MIELIWIIGTTFLIAILALIGIITFSLKEEAFEKLLILLVSFAAGTLLGTAFFNMIPETFHGLSVGNGRMEASVLIISGFVFFFALEEFLHWHHCHDHKCEHRKRPVSYLILVSNSIHNFIDGIIVGASFLVSVPLGITTAIAVAAHEIPQELGNFGIIVFVGWGKKRALLVNLMASLMIVPGGTVAYFAANSINPIYLIPFAAGSFIYIGAADLVPEVHGEENLQTSVIILTMFLLGVLVIVSIDLFIPNVH